MNLVPKPKTQNSKLQQACQNAAIPQSMNANSAHATGFGNAKAEDTSHARSRKSANRVRFQAVKSMDAQQEEEPAMNAGRVMGNA